MKLSSFRLRLDATPLVTAKGAFGPREALILTLDDGSNYGQGEASPLPGYSSESLDDVEAAFAAVDVGALHVVPELPRAAQLERWRALVPAAMPSARAALEMAMLDLVTRRAGVPAWRWFTEQPRRIEQSWLTGAGDAVSALEAAAEAEAREVGALKLKCGIDLERELAAALAVKARYPRLRLRFDANQAPSGAAARALLEALGPLDPDFVEEPTRELDALLGNAVPIALDESLQPLAAWPELAPRLSAIGVTALVVKPMSLGGLARVLRYAERAERHGLALVLSHLLDGPLAFSAAAALALAVGSPRLAAGLGPHAGLAAFPVQSPALGAGTLRAWSEPGLGMPRIA